MKDSNTMMKATFFQEFEAEILTSLPLQMALHYNVCFAPFWAIGLIVCFITKMSYLSVTYEVILFTLLCITTVVEFVRLFLGYYGNLAEKISALSGFWITSVILQVPIATFLALNSSSIPLPLERILCVYHAIFLFTEIVTSFMVIRKIALYQVVKFKQRVLDEDELKNRTE